MSSFQDLLPAAKVGTQLLTYPLLHFAKKHEDATLSLSPVMPYSFGWAAKKIVLVFSLLLASSLLVGCFDSDDSSKTTTTSPPDTSDPVANPPSVSGPDVSFIPQDPLLAWQWHLRSTGQQLGNGLQPRPGADLNLYPLWQNCPASGCKAEGVLVAVVDDGLQISHPDLIDNALPLHSSTPHRDFTRSTFALNQDPSPTDPEDAHGTAVAGLIAARDNTIGGLGVAPRASLLGVNLLAHNVAADTALEAQSMLHQRQAVAVSNNSWGTPDGSGFLNAAGASWQDAIELGLKEGFGGRGTAYIWAGGNGHELRNGYYLDYSNFDGQANFHGVFAVAAVNAEDKRASYSEQGSNLLISGYGGEFCEGNELATTTTDLSTPGWGYNTTNAQNSDLPDRRYSRCFNGTSSAAPTVAGVVALMRQANPQLGWRDLRWLLAHHARQNDPTNPNWRTNGGGLTYNREYGFGVADAAASVSAARSHAPLPAYRKQTLNGSAQALNASQVNTLSLNANTTLQRIEFMTLHLDLWGSTFDYDTGELEVRLISPAGTSSLIKPRRRCHDLYSEIVEAVACEDEIDFTFGSVEFLGEQPNGNWILRIDSTQQSQSANLESWTLTFYGH